MITETQAIAANMLVCFRHEGWNFGLNERRIVASLKILPQLRKKEIRNNTDVVEAISIAKQQLEIPTCPLFEQQR